MNTKKENRPVRLQKYLADCGFGSRRACEQFILDGRVAVDGEVVTELGVRVDPERQKVFVDGRPALPEPPVTLMVNKPPQVICTSSDPQGRTTVIDLIDDPPARIYTVGRLDYMSEGLILVTNDGDLAHALMHPRYHVEKVYRVWIDSPLTPREVHEMLRGIHDGGELLRVLSVEQEGSVRGRGVAYRIVLGEGRNRHIRRMMARLGKKVFRLQRIAIGPLRLGNLPLGKWRPLRPAEIKMLRRAVSEARDRGKKR